MLTFNLGLFFFIHPISIFVDTHKIEKCNIYTVIYTENIFFPEFLFKQHVTVGFDEYGLISHSHRIYSPR